MRPACHHTATRLLIANGLAITLVLLALGALGATAQSAQAEDQAISTVSQPTPAAPTDQPAVVTPTQPGTGLNVRPSLPDWVIRLMQAEGPQATQAITGLAASQMVDTGSGDNSIAYNGSTITYTLIVTNVSSSDTITNMVVIDLLPDDALNIQALNSDSVRTVCDTGLSTCDKGVVGQYVPEPLGGLVFVTATRSITWSIPILNPGQSTQLIINGTLEGQTDGTVFANRAFVDLFVKGVERSSTLDPVSAVARVPVQQGGATSLSDSPNWLSSDLGGTISQDWGDFDRDGQLDLVLGSSLGASVYRNVAGRLIKFWSDSRPAYGVRWADLKGNGQLELVAVGDSLDRTPTSQGLNYIYSYVGETFSQTGIFTSPYQLVRIAAGNFDQNISHTLDLIGSTNSINPACPVRRFRNDGHGNFSGDSVCISTSATAAIGVGDFNNDGYPDLALGEFPNVDRLFINHEGVLTESQIFTLTHTFTQTINVTDTITLTETHVYTNNALIVDRTTFLPYDFAWGDYNRDGYLDLAAAFPLQRQVRIYENVGGAALQLVKIIPTRVFFTPLSVDWADYNGDGWLDLAMADIPPRIYLNDHGSIGSSGSLTTTAIRGQVWSVRSVALQDNNVLNLALTNLNGPSQLFTAIGPHLAPMLTPIAGASSGNSVAWGDMNGDGRLDLIFGASAGSVNSKLFTNLGSAFGNERSFFSSGFGPHDVAVGDVNGDGQLDVAIGTGNNSLVQVYLVSNTISLYWSAALPYPISSVAFGDANDDGWLDLLAGTNGGPVYLFLNRNGQLAATPFFTTSETGDARSLAWTDINGDRYMDFAVGSWLTYTRVYRNDTQGGFQLQWTSAPVVSRTTSIAFADYNGDGSPDLTIGNYQAPTLVYDNIGGTFSLTPTWSSGAVSPTTSVAWGDWDNDGRPDLAVGNVGAPNVVYANLNSTPGTPRLYALWSSTDIYSTTGVAWGDSRNDGYLDLAISRSDGSSGIYKNTNLQPSHLDSIFTPTLVLPNNPAYLSIARPGNTKDAYLYSSSELLSGRASPTVTVHYRVYNPDGTRSVPSSNVVGGVVSNTLFEFSVDGGTHWSPATPAIGSPLPVTSATRLGTEGTFIWNAQADDAISDNVVFRIRVVDNRPVGPVQRASSLAASPPFRVRGLTCEWPANPSIIAQPTHLLSPYQMIKFTGLIANGSGVVTYTWNFGDGAPIGVGQKITHTYVSEGLFTVTMNVVGQPCPATRIVTATQTIMVGASNKLYLPLIARNSSGPQLSALTNLIEPVTQWLGLSGTTALSPDRSVAPDSRAAQPVGPESGPLSTGATAPIAPRADTVITYAPGIPINLTNSSFGYNSQPAINADGTRIAFWSTADLDNTTGQHNPDGNVELFWAEIDPSTHVVHFTQVTSSTGSILGGFNLAPSIDAGGFRIAFFSDRDLTGGNPDHNFEIFVADVGTGGAVAIRQVTTTTQGINVLPSISADGTRIAFVSDRNLATIGHNTNPGAYQQLFLAILDKATQAIDISQITNISVDIHGQPASNDHPTISADGSHIAFLSNGRNLTPANNNGNANPDGNTEVYVANVADPVNSVITFTQVTSTPVSVVNDHSTINANGTRVAYTSGGDGNRSAHLVQISAPGAVTELLQAGDNDQPALDSGDGYRIAAVSADGRQVNLLDGITDSPILITATGDLLNSNPSISDDSMHVAYVSNRQIYVVNYPLADLAITKTADAERVAPGGTLNYTLTVTNNGPAPASGVTVTDTLPFQLKDMAFTDQTDDDDSPTGFGGANPTTTLGVAWNNVDSALELSQTIPLAWELPDHASPSGWIDMSDDVLLMHLNDLNPLAGVADASGLSLSGFCPALCPQAGVPGKLSTAFDFENIHAAVQVTDTPNLNFNSQQSFSLLAWIKTSVGSAGGGANSKIIVKRSFVSNQWYTLQLQGRSTAALELNGGVAVQGGPDLRDNQWHLLVGVVDTTTSQAMIYVDGALRNSINFVADTSNTAPLNIGQWYDGSLESFTGLIDEVAIFGRALSPEEIASIYNWQAPVFRAGLLDSRVMDAHLPVTWDALSVTTLRPTFKQLPDDNIAETGYFTGNANMQSNVLLLHLNEISGTTFRDTSGSGNDASCAGSACPALGTAGIFSTAVSFDGVDDDIAVVPTTTSNLVMTNALAIEAWIYPTANNATGIIVNKEGEYEAARFSDGLIYWAFANSNPGWVWISTGINARLNQWLHLAITYDNGTIRSYANGNLVNVYNGSGDIGDVDPSLNELRIGGRQCCAQFFSGRIDEIAVYHRSLTDREILDHYLRGAQRLRFQVRSCSDPQCNDQPFSGPDGTSHTYYYIELPNTTPGPAAYTITVSNNRYFQYRTFLESNDLLGNPLGLVNVTVNPGHFGAIPSQGSCSGARTIVCDVGDLPVSGTAQIRLLTDVDPNTGGVFTNTTSVDSPAVDHQTSNNTAVQGPTRVNASADLSITGELLDNVVYAGSDFTYTLHITNAGPLAASSMKIVDALPISVTFKAFDASPGTGCFGTTPVITTVVCQFSSVLPADPITSVYASLVVTVDPSFHGTLTNTASVSAIQDDPNLSNNTLTQTVIALPAVDVAIHKSASTDTPVAGKPLTYTLTVTNGGPSTATAVRITDTLPAGAVFRSASPGCLGNAGFATVTCTLSAPLLVTQSAPLTIAVVISPDVRGPLVNTASVGSLEHELNPTNNTATHSVTVTAQANLTATKSAFPTASLNSGDLLTYTVLITNSGPSTALGVTMTDNLPGYDPGSRNPQPPVVDFKSVTADSPSSPTCTTSGQFFGRGNNRTFYTTTVTCALGLLNPIASSNNYTAAVTIVVTVTSRANNPIVNTASVTATEAITTVQASVSSFVNAQADLSISKSASPGPIVAGQSLTYTIAFSNVQGGASQFDAQNVVITDTLPPSVTFGSQISSTLSSVTGPTQTGQVLVWQIPTLVLNDSGQITFTVAVSSAIANQTYITNHVDIASTTPDPATANNQHDTTSLITAVANLTITKSVTPITVIAGNTLTYTISVTNNGPSQATNVVVTDTLPANLTSIISSTSTGGLCIGGNNLSCNIGSLAPGAPGIVTVTAKVDPGASGSIANTAYVTATDTPAVVASNVASTAVNALADLSVSKSRAGTARAGAVLTYTLSFNNTGPSDAQDVFITDTLPISVAFGGVVSISPPFAGPPSGSGRARYWNAGTLGASGSGQIVFTATIDVSATVGLRITNTLDIASATPDPDLANNHADDGGVGISASLLPLLYIVRLPPDAWSPVNLAPALRKLWSTLNLSLMDPAKQFSSRDVTAHPAPSGPP